MFAVRPLPLDGRIASLLLAAGAANGFVFRIVEAWKEQGADAALGFFGVSPFELLVIGVAAKLLSEATDLERQRVREYYDRRAFRALRGLAEQSPCLASHGFIRALRRAENLGAGARRRAAFRRPRLLGNLGRGCGADGVEMAPRAGRQRRRPAALLFRGSVVHYGNVVGQNAGHQIVILVGCSTAHLVPLAVLGATALMLFRLDRLTGAAAAGIVGLALALGIANLARLTLMALSSDAYLVIHNGAGAMAFDALNTMLIVAAAQLVPVRS